MKNSSFFALWPDNAVRMDLRVAYKSVVGRLPVGGRQTLAANYHLPLVRLGELGPTQEAAARAAADGVSAAPFVLRLDIAASSACEAQWWFGSHDSSFALAALQRQLRTRLARAGLRDDDTPFHPRVDFLHQALHALPERRIDAVHWPVCAFVLARRLNSAEGPVAVVIGHWPLQAAQRVPAPA